MPMPSPGEELPVGKVVPLTGVDALCVRRLCGGGRVPVTLIHDGLDRSLSLHQVGAGWWRSRRANVCGQRG